ncbi:MAG: hypothetical protein IAA31_04575 [Candidatus Anaerobiospirillum merdipullorum]|uniref:Uncharacterized protein n=1 Tax=Candidatus Anaerobiospirillum merdipullorum TaxID=2838450 RepID=A0A9E2KNT7_9GAMM|nr:hypothetical protein [Candidatus Anaerobiospirillum merdipullorum]
MCKARSPAPADEHLLIWSDTAHWNVTAGNTVSVQAASSSRPCTSSGSRPEDGQKSLDLSVASPKAHTPSINPQARLHLLYRP